MQAGAAPFDILDRGQEHFVGEERAILHGLVQADVILQHDPPGADVHMPCLGVARLAGLQTDGIPGGVQTAVRMVCEQAIPDRGGRQVDGIGLIQRADSPAIQDDQQHAAFPAPAVVRSQRCTGHGCRLRQAKGCQDRRSHIGQLSILKLRVGWRARIDGNELNRVGRMRHVRLSVRTGHRLQVAMVSRDQHDCIGGKCRLDHFAQVAIDQGRTVELCLVVGGMPDHIPIGKVGHDQVIVLLQSAQHLLLDLRQAEFRDLVEGNAFRGGDAHIVLPGERSAYSRR